MSLIKTSELNRIPELISALNQSPPSYVKEGLFKRRKMLIQKICNFCYTYYCKISCTSSSLPIMILEYLCVMEKTHQSMVLLGLHLSTFLLMCLLSLALFFSAHLHMFMSHWWIAASCQVPSDPAQLYQWLLSPFFSLLAQITVSCLQESKVKPEGRWFPHSPAVRALWRCRSHRSLYIST